MVVIVQARDGGNGPYALRPSLTGASGGRNPWRSKEARLAVVNRMHDPIGILGASDPGTARPAAGCSTAGPLPVLGSAVLGSGFW